VAIYHAISTGVSNPVFTDTGIPVFGTPVFAGIENVKMATFDKIYHLLRNNWAIFP
jgi:hypothetical protein